MYGVSCRFSTLSQLYRGSQCTYPCSAGILFTSTPHDVLSKPLTISQNHCRNKGQGRERDESCSNHYHQSSERILVEPGDRTSDLRTENDSLTFVVWERLKDTPVLVFTKLFTYFFFLFETGKNIVSKGENAGYPHFLHFLQVSKGTTFSGSLKLGIVWQRFNTSHIHFSRFRKRFIFIL